MSRTLLSTEILKIRKRHNTYYFLLFIFLLNVIGIFLMLYLNRTELLRLTPKTFYIVSTHNLRTLFLLLCILLSSTILLQEFKDRTLYLLLLAPCKRISIVLSKYFAVTLYCSTWLLITMILNATLGFLLLSIPLRPMFVLQQFLYSLPYLLFYSALSYCIALLFRSSNLGLLLSLMVLWFHPRINEYIIYQPWYRLVIFPNLNFEKYQYNIIQGVDTFFSLCILCVYVVILLLITYLRFNHLEES